MTLRTIMTAFHHLDREWAAQFNPNTEIYSFAFLDRTTVFDPHVLYIGFVSDLPLVAPAINLNFLCIADTKPSPCYTTDATGCLNLILLESTVTERTVVAVLTDVFGEDARISAGKAQLVNVLQENRGLQSIVDAAYNILQNPIIVADTGYRILAMYQNREASRERGDLEEQRGLGFVLESNIEAIRKAKLYEKVRRTGRPVYTKDDGAPYGWATALIHVHGIEVGHIGVMESLHPISGNDLEIIDFLSKIVALELQKNDFYRTNEGSAQGVILKELLDNKVADKSAFLGRMAAFGLAFSDTMRVMVLHDEGNSLYDGKIHLLTSQLYALIPQSCSVLYQGELVFLFPVGTTGGKSGHTDEKLLEKIAAYLRINRLSAGISAAFTDILSVQKYYTQAVKAFVFGSRTEPGKPLYQYRHYLFSHLKEIVSAHADITDFYHPAIREIQAYDRQHNTDFLRTLELYLTYIDQPARIAEELNVHKNTVFYRITKLKELFNLHLEDGEERSHLYLTIQFERG